MEMENTVFMRGDRDRIYELGANIQDWPRLLPHYRYVRVERATAHEKVAWMGAVRSGWPVRWKCRQELVPDEQRILFKHIGGITRGMEVEWRLAQEPEGVRVTIWHQLSYPIPLLGPLFAKYIVGRLFVHHIAGKTLACIREKVERER